MSSHPLLQAEGLTKTFAGGVTALAAVNFTLHSGEVHALVGENGAGKSTFTRIIAGDYPPDTGELRMDGQAVRFESPRDAIDKGVRLVTQERALVPTLSITENILLGRLPRNRAGLVDWRLARVTATRIMQRIGMQADPSARVSELHPAAQQEVEICKALAGEARVLILDEPTAALSSSETDRLFDVIRELRGEGVGVIYISHRIAEIRQVADRITVLRDGSVVTSTTPDGTTNEELVRLMVGRELTDVYHTANAAVGEVVLRLQRVSSPGICENVSLTVRSGEIVALFGVVGSGATEIPYLAATGHVPAGQVTTVGQPGLVPIDRRSEGLLPQATVRRNIGAATLSQYARAGVFRRNRERTAARDQIRTLDIRPSDPEHPVAALSGGNQQKSIVARWLQAGATALILCEPTRGVDVGARAEIYHLLRERCRSGAGCLVASTDVDEVAGLADRVHVVVSGRIVQVLEGEAITPTRILEAATQ